MGSAFDRLVGAPTDPPDEDNLEDLMPPATAPGTYGSPSGVYGKLYSRGKNPPTSDVEAARRFRIGLLVGELERAALDGPKGIFGPNPETRKAFWELNTQMRQVEAWAGPGLGAEVMPEIKAAYTHWRDISEKWKRGSSREQLSSLQADVRLLQNSAEEYGWPNAYHSDRRDLAAGKKSGEVNRAGSKVAMNVDIPAAEDQSDFLKFAQEVDKVAPPALKPGGPTDLWNKIPLPAKIIGGATLGAVIIGQFARLFGR